MSERPWYRRFPDNFIAGTVGLTLEEKGAYSLVLDLIYVRGGPVPDEPRYIAGVCNCSVRKWNAIRQRLIDLGKIAAIDGRLMNPRAEKELEISAKTAEERAESGSKGGVKSAENRDVRSKSNDLGQAALKHTRASPLQDQYRKKERSSISKEDGANAPKMISVDRFANEALFKACEEISGKPVPSFMQKQVFEESVVAQARARLIAEDDAHAA